MAQRWCGGLKLSLMTFANASSNAGIPLLLVCLFACSSGPERQLDNAFVRYWPPAEGAQGLRLAVKDLIDMKGQVTSAGSEYLAKHSRPATVDAACLAIARERGVTLVGKTNLTEFAITVSGRNAFFGTPKNQQKGQGRLISGGSSSGSAVAVSAGHADVAFGTDTGGSIRVPAACCNIYGLKTTFGLVPTQGVFPISAKHLDTVGPMARDIPTLVQGMDLLQRGFAAQYAEAVSARPSARGIRVGRLYLAGTDARIDQSIDAALAAAKLRVIPLDESFRTKWLQAQRDGETIALGDAWTNDQAYADKPGVDRTTRLVLGQGERELAGGYAEAVKRKAAWQRELRRVFAKLDVIAVPTMQNLPPRAPRFGSGIVFEWLVFHSQNTMSVNLAGNPALAMPIAMPRVGKTTPMTSLQLIGPRRSEAELLNVGRIIAVRP